MKVGNVELFLLIDGWMRTDGGGMFGLVPKVMWEKKHAADDQNCILMRVGGLLIKTGEHRLVVDTGLGSKMAHRTRTLMGVMQSGDLPRQLGERGVKPADVDLVINTHLHFDHAGGNTTLKEGEVVPTFPNATYMVQTGEWESTLHTNERTRATYLPENLLPVREAGRLQLIEGDTQVTPEVRCLLTPGHTLHHQSVLIESEGERAIYLADVSPFAVHLERLPWVPAYDLDPMRTIETRRWLRQWAVEQQPLLIFPHDPEVGMGRLHADSGRYWIEELVAVGPEPSAIG